MWFSLNFSCRSLASPWRRSSRRLLAKKNQDYSIYNFVMKNRALQPFMSRLIATSLYSYRTRLHNRQIIWVTPVLLKFWTTVSSTLNEEIGPCGHDKLVELPAWTLKREIQNPIHLPAHASNPTTKPPNMHGQYVVITVNVIKVCCAVK